MVFHELHTINTLALLVFKVSYDPRWIIHAGKDTAERQLTVYQMLSGIFQAQTVATSLPEPPCSGTDKLPACGMVPLSQRLALVLVSQP